MKAIGYGVVIGAVWLWVEQPFALAVAGGILAGLLVGLGLGRMGQTATDPARLTLRAVMAGAPRRTDGSISVPDPSTALLDRLWREADHLADCFRYGDHDPDTLADYNAAKAMQRRVEAAR